MTVSPDARTPSAPVHALSGSSAGPGRPFAPVASLHELPDPFVPLGDAAAGVVRGLVPRRPGPDAEVIDLAGRVKRLAERELRLVLRTCKIEDAVLEAMRPHPRPELSEPKLRFTTQRSTEADGTRVMVIREPAGWAAESKTLREAYDAALAERERREEQEGARRNLPYWNKLRERARNRLYRWILQLAATKPTTQAGLAAKAAAADAIVEDEELPCDWHQTLAISVSRDVVRLSAAGCDAELFALLARWQAVQDGRPATEAACDAALDRAKAAYPSRPAALSSPASDHWCGLRASASGREKLPEGRWRCFWDASDVDQLRSGPPPMRWASVDDDHEGPPPQEIDERGEARRQQIIATHDEWVAAREAVEDAVGFTAANAAWEAQIDALNAAENAVKLRAPRTLAGLARKAAWAADLLARDAADDDLAEVFARQVAAFAGQDTAVEPTALGVASDLASAA